MNEQADALTEASASEQAPVGTGLQACGFLLELSPDWLVMRASENVHRFIGSYHVRVTGEPLTSFTLAQPLHDLRNSLARQRSSAGVARAYRVRLTDDRRYFDIAFRQLDGRLLLEGVPSPEAGFGDSLGSISRLVDGLHAGDRHSLLESAARRMRALTGFDRAIVRIGDELVVSSRADFGPPPNIPPGSSTVIADTKIDPVPIYPRDAQDTAVEHALLRAPEPAELQRLRDQGIRSVLSVPVFDGEKPIGSFTCDSRTPVQPSFELHAAAELFAQIFAIHLNR